jgi:hypothetical protein
LGSFVQFSFGEKCICGLNCSEYFSKFLTERDEQPVVANSNRIKALTDTSWMILFLAKEKFECSIVLFLS